MNIIKKEVEPVLCTRGKGHGILFLPSQWWQSGLKHKCQANMHTDKCKTTNSPKCYKGKEDHEMK